MIRTLVIAVVAATAVSAMAATLLTSSDPGAASLIGLAAGALWALVGVELGEWRARRRYDRRLAATRSTIRR